MSVVKAKPRRSMRNELLSLAAVLSLPAAVVAVFPPEPFWFQAKGNSSGGPTPPCAFVSLSAEEEARALANARASWRVSAEDARSMSFDLLYAASMSEEPARAVTDVSTRARPEPPRPPAYDAVPMPPTFAAPPPAKIAADPEPDGAGAAFSRQEMLRLD